MTVEILQSKEENTQARYKMKRREIDCMGSSFRRFFLDIGMLTGVKVGEPQKSWDVLKTVEFIEKTLLATDPILDIGAYASEILCSLHRLNYSHLTGIDLNPNVRGMPFADKIRYVNYDFLQTPFEDSSFAAITAISVIEHGLRSKRLLGEMSRLLKPSGYFIASVDYWPDKVQTDGINVFGMDWRIFSRDELYFFIDEAKAFGLDPVGKLHFEADKPTVRWQEREYTFAWIAMQKNK